MPWFFEFVAALSGLIFKALWWFFTEFYSWLFGLFKPLLQAALSGAGLNFDLSYASDFFSYINYFMPLSETLSMLTIVFVFWLRIFILKVTKKLIPFWS